MRRIKALLLIILAALLINACAAETNKKTTATEETTKTISKKDKKDKASKKNKKETTEEVTIEDEEEDEEDTAQAAFDPSEVAEQVVYDDEGIKVTVTGYGEDTWGPYLDVLIENDSNQTINVQTRNVSVNGYMSPRLLYCDVIAGKKAKTKLEFDEDSLELSGIEEIQDIEFSLSIVDSNYETVAESDMISVTRNLPTKLEQNYDDSGVVAYDQDGIKIISKEMIMDDYGYVSLMLYIENNTDQTITIQSKDSSVNSFMIDATISSTILPGKKTIGDLFISYSDLEDLDITTAEEIKTIETTFQILEEDGWDILFETDPVTFNIE